MSKHKKQHYLPNFYLKGFANGPQGINGNRTGEYNVWFYNKKTNELIFKSTKNVAYEPYYYSYKNRLGEYIHDIELEFSRLEDLSKKAFKKIEDSVTKLAKHRLNHDLTIDKNDIIDICQFIANMMRRNTKIIDNMTKELTEFYEKQSMKYNHIYDSEEIKKGVLSVMRDIGKNDEYNFLKKLITKNFYFLYITKANMSFITSDFPVVTFRKNGPSGIAYSDTEIYFPINKYLLLTLYGEGGNIYFKKFNDSKKISHLNRYIAKTSHNIIIGRDKELLEKLLKVFS